LIEEEIVFFFFLEFLCYRKKKNWKRSYKERRKEEICIENSFLFIFLATLKPTTQPNVGKSPTQGIPASNNINNSQTTSKPTNNVNNTTQPSLKPNEVNVTPITKLNPNAKEFKPNPNAKEWTPKKVNLNSFFFFFFLVKSSNKLKI